LSKRLPSGGEIIAAFAICAVVVYSWPIFLFLDRVPGWLFHLELPKILSIFAYTQAFALFESLVVLGGLLLATVLLPTRLFRHHFVGSAGAVVLVLTAWAIAAQRYDDLIRTWSTQVLLSWLLVALASVVLALLLVRRSAALERSIVALAQRLTAFLYLYLPISFVSLATVLVRNV
jgi:hypothetical protein